MDEIELSLDEWPDCRVPGCPNKCCLALDSVFCYPHTGEFFVAPSAVIEEVTIEVLE